jgi:hypothetical protein
MLLAPGGRGDPGRAAAGGGDAGGADGAVSRGVGGAAPVSLLCFAIEATSVPGAGACRLGRGNYFVPVLEGRPLS